ncbi:hypothetical protein F5Y16DRAFT_403861 [Xylariaceae sp. FL0255]|nr:hypothetical protein F5Y16DRAFT_403861 [Xylariaceae sp. FL0255]
MARQTTALYNALFLLLSLFSLVGGAAIEIRKPLAPRQSTTTTTTTTTVDSCANYARVANLSAVATNTTLRGAFLRSTPLGFFVASAILDAETPQLMSLMMNQQLNAECQNLSALAVTEAAANFSAGTVLGLEILPAVGVDPGNLALPFLCVFFILFMGGSAMAL